MTNTTPTTATSSQTVTDGKATLVVTTTVTNSDESTTEVVNTSAPQSKAQVEALQTQLTGQLVQFQGQVNIATARLSAITSALANTALV